VSKLTASEELWRVCAGERQPRLLYCQLGISQKVLARVFVVEESWPSARFVQEHIPHFLQAPLFGWRAFDHCVWGTFGGLSLLKKLAASFLSLFPFRSDAVLLTFGGALLANGVGGALSSLLPRSDVVAASLRRPAERGCQRGHPQGTPPCRSLLSELQHVCASPQVTPRNHPRHENFKLACSQQESAGK